MRKNKGFTLIELLAVIVILAIIAVITVPKVAEMIDTSRKGAAEDAFYGSIKAAELAWAKTLQSDTTLPGASCEFNDSAATCTRDDNVTGTGKSVVYSSSGTNAKTGTITLSTAGAASVTTGNALQFNGYYCCGTSSKVYCKRATTDGTNPITSADETGGACTAS